MVIEKSPDFLPAGWIREAKERPNGRTDWYYINLRTGERCRSKIEVSRHTKSRNLCSDMPRPNRRSLRDNKKQLVVQMEDLPDWLPTGWSMETKTRKHGTTAGKPYKCYISSTGCKFYSKGEVFRYLENGTIRNRTIDPNKRDPATHCHSSEPRKRDVATHCHTTELKERDTAMHRRTSEPKKRGAAVDSTKSASKVVVEKHTEKGLPPECIKEVKITTAIHSARSSSKVVVENHTEEGLPPGWFKEVKVTKVAGRTRKDPFYIDPVTGYEFRSKKDVFRYLESNDIEKCAIRPKKRQISDMETVNTDVSPLTAAKKHKIADSATRRSLFAGQSSILSKAVDDEVILESSSVVEKCLSLPFFSLDGVTSQMNIDHQEFKGINDVERKIDLAEAGFISAPAVVSQGGQPLEKLNSVDGGNSKVTNAAQESESTPDKVSSGEKDKFLSREADVFAMKHSSENGGSTELIGGAPEHEALENAEEKMLCDEKGLISAPSKQLHSADGGGSEPGTSAQQESEGMENMEQKILHAENGLTSACSTEASPEKQPSGKSLGKRKSRAQLRTIGTQDGEKTILPRRASKRLAGLEAELTPDLDMSERTLRMVARQPANLEKDSATGVNPSCQNHRTSKSVDQPLKTAAEVVTTSLTCGGVVPQLDENASMGGGRPTYDEAAPEGPNRISDWEKQCIENTGVTTRKFDSEKQSIEKPEEGSSIDLPFGDLWPDPCLEFAFKTLTGAIPVDENLVIGDYMQENVSMDQNKSFTLPDLGSDGCCQRETFFQFGSAEKPAAKHQSPGKSTCASQGNCVMVASGDGALQQQPNGKGPKEC